MCRSYIDISRHFPFLANSGLWAASRTRSYGLCIPYLVNVNHGDARHSNGRTQDLRDPLGTVTSRVGQYLAVPYLQQYYGTQQRADISEPMPTLTAKDRSALCMAFIDPCVLEWPEPTSAAMEKLQATMRELDVADIGFRMFSNPELARAMDFDEDYVFEGSKSQITKQIGNAVSPAVAEAQALAIAAA